MAFTYPSASESIVKGNQFYRIKGQANELSGGSLTAIGPGSLIPIDTGFSAIAVGPESAYEKYELFYPDPTAPGGIQRIPFSKDRPLVGNVRSDNVSEYPNANGEVARAFVRVADFGSFATQKTTYPSGGPAAVSSKIAECLVDLQIYTNQNPTVLPTNRVPHILSGSVVVVGASSANYVLPGYGRRIVDFSVFRRLASSEVNITVTGFLFSPKLEDFSATTRGRTVASAATSHLGKELATGSAGVIAGQFHFTHNADNNGYFDFYQLNIAGTGTDIPNDNGISSYYSILRARD